MSSRTGGATAVSIFHRTGDAATFLAWVDDQLVLAREAAGFGSARISVLDQPQLDWAVAVTFGTEDRLHAWLDSPVRSESMHVGAARGCLVRSTDLVIVEGDRAPAGVEAFTHSVAAGRVEEFVTTQVQLNAASSQLAGFEGTALFGPGTGDQWLSVVRFRTAEQLSVWLRSSERKAALGALRTSLTKEFAPLSSTTPFATTVRTEHGRTLMTPNWKSAMMVLLVLYPTVMLLSRFVGPALDAHGAQPWLALWVSQILSISLMQWWLMPWVTKPFRRWLDPVDGRGMRIGVLGATVIVVGYALTLTVFATVQWLQFWDFGD